MIDRLVLHPRAREQVLQYLAAPSHAILLIGSHGIGKTHLADSMAAHILGIPPDSLHAHPYHTVIRPEGASISIDAVRDLQRFLQLKTLGSGRAIRRTIIIEHADALTTEAQNAFLKLLEEPPADTVLFLTASSKQTLLPTIMSRVQAISLPVPPIEDVRNHFSPRADTTTLTQALFLSGGLPGLMHALVSSDTTHPLMEGVITAKTILQKNTFERMALVEGLAKNKDNTAAVLEALTAIAHASLNGATGRSDAAAVKRWHHILKVTHQAREALAVNANAKLTLTNLMLNL